MIKDQLVSELGRLDGDARIAMITDLHRALSMLGVHRTVCERKNTLNLVVHLQAAQEQINEVLTAHEQYKNQVLSNFAQDRNPNEK